MCIFVTNGILEAVQEFLSHKQNWAYLNSIYLQTAYCLFGWFFFVIPLHQYFLVLAVIFPFQNEPCIKPSHPSPAGIPLGHSASVPSQGLPTNRPSRVTLHLYQFNYIFLGGKWLKARITEDIPKTCLKTPEFGVELPEAAINPALNPLSKVPIFSLYQLCKKCDWNWAMWLFQPGLTNALQGNYSSILIIHLTCPETVFLFYIFVPSWCFIVTQWPAGPLDILCPYLSSPSYCLINPCSAVEFQLVPGSMTFYLLLLTLIHFYFNLQAHPSLPG